MKRKYNHKSFVINIIILLFLHTTNTYASTTAILNVRARLIGGYGVNILNPIELRESFELTTENNQKLPLDHPVNRSYSSINIKCPAGVEFDIDFDSGDNLTDGERTIFDGYQKHKYELFHHDTNIEIGPEHIGGQQVLQDQTCSGNMQTHKLYAHIIDYNIEKLDDNHKLFEKSIEDLPNKTDWVEITVTFD